MSSSEGSYDDDSVPEGRWDHSSSSSVRVCIRLRPMNKLEASRRSKNCVEFHDDPHIVTVDSPLEGEFDFGFDRVFDEYASQVDVFEHTASPVAKQLLDGYNCTVMAYGQTGSGKTHTMIGPGGGTIRSPEKSPLRPHTVEEEKTPDKRDSGMTGKMDDKDLGMIPRTISAIFALMEKSAPSIEYTVRCSYVEIYLEKILDLLNPREGGGAAPSIVDDGFADEAAGSGDRIEGANVVGASELCCLDESDVISLLDRGNACRTVSSTKMNTDSSRSHAIFILKLEQRDGETGETKKSMLHMVDLAGSEMAGKTENQNFLGTSAVQAEAKMINKSLSALTNIVRARMKRQKGANVSFPASSLQYKLTRLLGPCFGGNCMTTVILTASPSSYNIGETISAIRFGQCCRQIKNPAIVNFQRTADYYKKRLARSEKKQSELIMLVKALAGECRDLKAEGSHGPIDRDRHSGPLWESIDQILCDDDEGEPDYVVVVRKGGNGPEKADDAGEHDSGELQSHPEKESSVAELQSEVAVLRTQNENLNAESKKVVQELIDAKNEIQVISQRKIEVEHNLRTSQFRENEATVFLRQFRRFYRRLLRNKAAQGTGGTQEITTNTPGVPDLNDLIDVDTLLVESGLIEEDEMHDDTAAGTYRPSSAALLRSTAAAKKAGRLLERDGSVKTFNSSVHSETSEEDLSSHVTSSTGPAAQSLDMISETGDGQSTHEGKTEGKEAENDDGSIEKQVDEVVRGADAGAGAATSDPSDPLDSSESIRTSSRNLSGAAIADRQRMLRTPAGRLVASKEKDLERDFLKMTEKCIELQMELDEERANLEAANNRYNKKREAQEAIQLRQQLDKKTHDLQAIIWKMNELHLINKTYNDKMANREQHVTYLEENLADLQNTNKKLMRERHESEKKLREELDNLKTLIDGATVPLWQFGEPSTQTRPVASRIVVPFVGEERKIDMDVPSRRMSEGASEPSLDSDAEDLLDYSQSARQKELRKDEDRSVEMMNAETQTEARQEHDSGKAAVSVETSTAQTQTVSLDTNEIAIQTDSLPEPDSPYPSKAGHKQPYGAEDGDEDSSYEDRSNSESEEEMNHNVENNESGQDAGHYSSDEEYMNKGEMPVDRHAGRNLSENYDRPVASHTPNGTHEANERKTASFTGDDVGMYNENVAIPSRYENADNRLDMTASDNLFHGGKPADFKPRQFVKKTGPGIKAAVLKDRRKKPGREESRRRLTKKKSGSMDGRRKKKKSTREDSRRLSKTASQIRRESRSSNRSHDR